MVSAHPPRTTDPVAAGAALRAGRLVGLPTETVYGLAADATSSEAVLAIFAAKQRPSTSPLIVHLADARDIETWATDIPDWARALAAACWPGPLTLVLTSNGHAAREVTAGGATVALRVPDHSLARAAIAASGTGVAAPSANRHGAVSPTRATHVIEAFDAETVACVLDGGPCHVGIESTIVDCTGETPVILRPGAIDIDMIARVTGYAVSTRLEHLPATRLDAAPTPAPGQARSHYAPRAEVRTCASTNDALELAAQLRTTGRRVALVLGDGPKPTGSPMAEDQVLLATSDAAEFARGLYESLRAADAAGAEVIIVVPPVGPGLAVATLDRITRAAAPRDADQSDASAPS